MLQDALEYPRRGDEPVRTLAVGSLLTALAVLFVPLLFVVGYVADAAEAVEAGNEVPPPVSLSASSALVGLRGVVIALAYFVPPGLVLVVADATTSLSFGVRSGSPGVSGLFGFLGIALAVLVALPCWYVGAAGFVNFARMGRFSAAFNRRQVEPALRDETYAGNWLLALVVVLAAGLVGGVLSVLPVWAALPLGGVVGFYAMVAAAYLYARGFGDARVAAAAADQPAGQAAA